MHAGTKMGFCLLEEDKAEPEAVKEPIKPKTPKSPNQLSTRVKSSQMTDSESARDPEKKDSSG